MKEQKIKELKAQRDKLTSDINDASWSVVELIYYNNVIEWLDFKIHQWQNGEFRQVNVNQLPKQKVSASLLLHYPQKYEDQWVPAPINFPAFMEWRIQKLLK